MDALQPLFDWVELNPEWIAITVGLVAFVESLAVVGIVVPGIALLGGLAAAAGGLGINPASLLIGAAIGAFIGDNLSFWIGRAFRPWLENHSTIQKYEPQLEKTRYFLNHKGAVAVVVGRFLGPIRPFMPMVAGMMLMRPTLFLGLSCFSTLAWAPFYILPAWYIAQETIGK